MRKDVADDQVDGNRPDARMDIALDASEVLAGMPSVMIAVIPRADLHLALKDNSAPVTHGKLCDAFKNFDSRTPGQTGINRSFYSEILKFRIRAFTDPVKVNTGGSRKRNGHIHFEAFRGFEGKSQFTLRLGFDKDGRRKVDLEDPGDNLHHEMADALFHLEGPFHGQRDFVHIHGEFKGINADSPGP